LSTGGVAIALVKDAQHIRDEQNEQYSAQPDARAAAGAPTPVTVISAATAKYQKQDDNQYQHSDLSLFFPKLDIPEPGTAAL
jgi:hypothetical protein